MLEQMLKVWKVRDESRLNYVWFVGWDDQVQGWWDVDTGPAMRALSGNSGEVSQAWGQGPRLSEPANTRIFLEKKLHFPSLRLQWQKNDFQLYELCQNIYSQSNLIFTNQWMERQHPTVSGKCQEFQIIKITNRW